MRPHEPSSIGKGHCTFVQGPGFEPGMPTYSPLRGEFLAARLPDQKKKCEKSYNTISNYMVK
jgi:hypothetical protein